MEPTAELIEDLTSFQFSKEAKTEDAKFAELYRVWQQVLADLVEVGRADILDHEPTLSKFGSRLPSNASRTKYVELRMEMLAEEEPKTELTIMTTFLQQERRKQKHLGRLEGKTQEPQAPTLKAGTKCFNCNKEGHRSSECPEKSKSVRKSHASVRVTQKVCPACIYQHSFPRNTLYRTRLSSCPTFVNLGPVEQANIIQAAAGCALCLDWTGSHTRDNCDSRTKTKPFGNCTITTNGVECGARHNSLLHGTTSKFCNLAQVHTSR